MERPRLARRVDVHAAAAIHLGVWRVKLAALVPAKEASLQLGRLARRLLRLALCAGEPRARVAAAEVSPCCGPVAVAGRGVALLRRP